uniref:G-protein coupled receptors family 1 profile domain-containing protein n=1 Tax=Anopheles culicifacies TaxID=139723 RepID=A0A182MEJ9_9DIPT
MGCDSAGITSITTLTVLSYERYCLISRPFSSRNLSRRGAFLAIFFIWGYSFALTSPPLFGWGAYVQEAANIRWVHTGHSAQCRPVVPLIVIVYSYTNIIVNMRKNSARVGRINRAEQRVTSMVAVMIVAFMVAWTPYAIFALIEQFGPPELIGPGLAVLPALIAKSSICYNPIIYVGMNTQFRAAFTRVRNKGGGQMADQNTTTMQRELTKSSRDMVECSFDFCRKKNRFKISLVKPTAPLAVVDVSSTSHPDKGTSRSPLDQTVLNEMNEEVGGRERSSGYAGTRFVRPDFELSVINSGKSILIKSKNFRSNLL